MENIYLQVLLGEKQESRFRSEYANKSDIPDDGNADDEDDYIPRKKGPRFVYLITSLGTF